MIGLPSAVIGAVKVVAIIGAAIWFLNLIHSAGYDKAEKKWREIQVEAQGDKVHAIQTLRDSLRSQAIDMSEKVAELNQRNLKDNQNAEIASDILIDNIMSGAYKLRVRTETGSDNGTVCGGSEAENDNPRTESRSLAETTSELHPTVTKNLFGITGDADLLAEDYNYLIGYVKLIREKCAAK